MVADGRVSVLKPLCLFDLAWHTWSIGVVVTHTKYVMVIKYLSCFTLIVWIQTACVGATKVLVR